MSCHCDYTGANANMLGCDYRHSPMDAVTRTTHIPMTMAMCVTTHTHTFSSRYQPALTHAPFDDLTGTRLTEAQKGMGANMGHCGRWLTKLSAGLDALLRSADTNSRYVIQQHEGVHTEMAYEHHVHLHTHVHTHTHTGSCTHLQPTPSTMLAACCTCGMLAVELTACMYTHTHTNTSSVHTGIPSSHAWWARC